MVIPDKGYKVHPGYGLRITQSGVFDWNLVYSTIQDWLFARKYDIDEKENTVKESQKGKEVTVKFACVRREDPYTSFKIDVDIHILYMKDIMVDNKRLQHGDFEVIFKSDMVLDRTGSFDESKFTALLRRIYNNYFKREKIKNVEETKLLSEVNELHSKTKEALELYK